MTRCPFCKCDPYEYVDNGCGMERVAVSCCDPGIALFSRGNSADKNLVIKILDLRRSYSPRKKARALRLMAENFP